MIDYADVIKARVSVPDAVERYTTERIVRNRIRCPVHHGTDYNMRIYSNSYYCYVCHATGDVIQFVRAVTGDSFQDSMVRLNDDFSLHLPLNGKSHHGLDKNSLAELERDIARRRLADLFKSVDERLNGMHQANLVGLLHTVDVICRTECPKSEWDVWTDTWCAAMKVRTELKGEL